MDIKALKTFQTIVNLGSFHRAAEELNYAQSTVTMQMQKLESDAGVQLIERGKQMCLTETGRILYEQSLHIVKDMERLKSTLDDLKSGEAGSVRLGVTDPTASYRLPRILEHFFRTFPKIEVSINIASTANLSEQILHGDLDIALCSAPELGKGLYFEPLFTEEFMLLIPERHPLASQEKIVPGDLLAHRLLITAAHCPYRKKLESVLRDSGGPPMNTMEIGSMTALKYFVESGLGIALVPSVMLSPVPARTVARRLEGTRIDMICGMLCKISEYPLKQASLKLHQFLRQELMKGDLHE